MGILIDSNIITRSIQYTLIFVVSLIKIYRNLKTKQTNWPCTPRIILLLLYTTTDNLVRSQYITSAKQVAIVNNIVNKIRFEVKLR